MYDFLLNYRIAKFVSTDVSPAETLFHRKIRGNVPNINQRVNLKALQNMQTYHDTKLRASESQVRVGDYVLVQQPMQNKLTSCYDPSPYRVTKQEGTMITAERPTRNIQHFKLLSKDIPSNIFDKGEKDKLEDDILEHRPQPQPLSTCTTK